MALGSALFICSGQTEAAQPDSSGKPGDLHQSVNSTVQTLLCCNLCFPVVCMGSDSKVTPKRSERKGAFAEEGEMLIADSWDHSPKRQKDFQETPRAAHIQQKQLPGQAATSLKASGNRGCTHQPSSLPHHGSGSISSTHHETPSSSQPPPCHQPWVDDAGPLQPGTTGYLLSVGQ